MNAEDGRQNDPDIPPEGSDATASERRERRGPWPGFWPWLVTTVLLLLMIGGLAWHLNTREAQVVEVTGPTPPPAEPSEEIQAEASDLRQQIALKQQQLGDAINALDPPVCEAPKELDLARLAELRTEEADNFRRWRALLLPVPAVLPSSPSQSAPSQSAPSQSAPQQPDNAPIRRESAPADTDSQGGIGDQGAISPITPAPIRVAASGQTSPMTTHDLRERLEQSSAIVLGIPVGDGQGLNTGTGFFISPTTLVTNFHVVENSDPGRLFVTSDALGRAQPVKLLAISRKSQAGSIDLALLQLTYGSARTHVPLSPQIDKLSEVIAAGYPGLTLGSDTGFRRLIQGDLSEAPDLNMNKGEIRSIRPFGEITQIIHTADVLKGYSGGPLMDACGRVVGVNTFVQVDRSQASKTNNAISVTDLSGFLTSKGVSVTLDNRACIAR